jgi:hypothetical protein
LPWYFCINKLNLLYCLSKTFHKTWVICSFLKAKQSTCLRLSFKHGDHEDVGNRGKETNMLMSLTDFKAKMNKSKINKYKINNNNKTNTKQFVYVKIWDLIFTWNFVSTKLQKFAVIPLYQQIKPSLLLEWNLFLFKYMIICAFENSPSIPIFLVT